MSTWMVTRADIAEIHEALGNHWQAGVYRRLDESNPDEATGIEVADDVTEILNKVPEPPDARLKHGEDCWQRHAICLATRVYEVLP